MTSEFQKGIISLIRSAITSEQVSLPDNFDWNRALITAGKHQIIPLLFYGIYNSGIELPDEISNKLKYSTYAAAATDALQNRELSLLFQAFSENGVNYMPLKGTLLKRLYPNSEMRVMSDADILIKVEQSNIISGIMVKLGFLEKEGSDHELIWSKPNLVVELHKYLIPSYNKDYYKYYSDGWRLGRRSEYDNCCYELCAEDQLIYLFTHFSKHYRNGGIGVKYLVDFWIFLNKNPEMNMDYIRSELTMLQLYKFYQNVLETINVWFCGAKPNEISDFITERIFASGAYGTHEGNLLASYIRTLKTTEKSVSGLRWKKTLNVIFLPFKSMCIIFPVLKVVPALLPIFWVLRMIQTCLFKPENIKKQQSDLSITTVDKINKYYDELIYVGLDFNFGE